MDEHLPFTRQLYRFTPMAIHAGQSVITPSTHYPHHFYRDDYWPAPYYPSNGTSSSLDGYGWSATPPAFSYIAAREPIQVDLHMFSNKAVRTKVVGTSIVSMRNSAGGSYIFVGPGRRNGKSSEEFTSSVKTCLPPTPFPGRNSAVVNAL